MSNCSHGHFDADAGGRDAGVAICLYGFVDAGAIASSPPAGPETLQLRVGSIRALIGTVVLDEYCGAAGERNLADPAWLAPRARRHAEIVQAAARRSPVFPIPFGTLYRGLDSLGAFMRRYEALIVRFLRTVEGRSEWGLKATLGPQGIEDLEAMARDVRPEWSLLAPGTRYMRMCSERPALIAAGRERAAARIDEIVAELRPLAADVRRIRQRETGGPEREATVGAYALLVDDRAAAALSERLDAARPRAAAACVGLTLTGPWPAFSFRPDLSAADPPAPESTGGGLFPTPAA